MKFEWPSALLPKCFTGGFGTPRYASDGAGSAKKRQTFAKDGLEETWQRYKRQNSFGKSEPSTEQAQPHATIASCLCKGVIRETAWKITANDMDVYFCQGHFGKIPVRSSHPSAISIPKDQKSSNSTPAFGKGGLQETWDYYQDLVGPRNLDTLSLEDRRVNDSIRLHPLCHQVTGMSVLLQLLGTTISTAPEGCLCAGRLCCTCLKQPQLAMLQSWRGC
jgi:hypothetical protein